MNLPPILAALRKHKAGVTLIMLQIALTLAIVCNAVFIIGQRIERVNRPTGMNEQNLFMIGQMFIDTPAGHGPIVIAEVDAMERADLATLRSLPGVVSATTINTLPLIDAGYVAGVDLKPDQRNETASASIYQGGNQVLKTLGLRLVSGRNFSPDEVTHSESGTPHASAAIVSEALARAMFPHGHALGQVMYLDGVSNPTTIIGVVARLQAPYSAHASGEAAWNTMLLPVRDDSIFTRYAVRARPGQLSAVMREAHKALVTVNPMRVMNNGFNGALGIHSFTAIRANAYRVDVGMAILMGIISVILLTITGAGIVGLTSFWVGQRRKQIGIRRALGATRHDILRYFQIENLFISGMGVVLGAILAMTLNLWMMKQFQMNHMPLVYVLVSIIILLALGQGSVFIPALRASRVSPVESIRVI